MNNELENIPYVFIYLIAIILILGPIISFWLTRGIKKYEQEKLKSKNKNQFNAIDNYMKNFNKKGMK